jgi:uncharacterized protein DUF6498
MTRLLRVAQLIGLNSVPVIGIVWAGWPNGTALALYWCESVIMILLVTLRIDLHRRATNKRGHYVGVKISSTTSFGRRGLGTRPRTNLNWTPSVWTYNRVFVLTALAFAVAEAVFLAVVVARLGWDIDRGALAGALRATATFLVLGFAIDMIGLRRRRFAWIRRMAEAALGRVFLLVVVAAGGLFLAAAFDLPRAVFVIFGVLKLYNDVASQFPQYEPHEAPAWVVTAVGLIGMPAEELRKDWRAESEINRLADIEDEEPFDGRPSRDRKLPATAPSTRLPP